MILKDKKLFFLGIFLIFGLIVSLSAVSAENIQDVSDTDLVSLGDEKIVLTDSGDESGGGDSGDNPGDNPAGDNPGDNPAGDNPGDNPAGGDDPGTGVSTKKETSLTVTAEPANVNQEAFIDITLKDSDEAEINANVIVNIDDEDKDVTIDNGIGRLTLSGLSIGSHHFTVTFAETDDYLGSTAQGTLEITKVKTAIVISADPVYVGDDALIDITLVDDENNMIDGEFKVTVNVNGEDKEVDITDGSGNLTLPNLGVNNYPISASFSGDDTYDGCEATGSLDVKKIPTTLTISAPAIIAGSNAVIKVTLKDKDGNNLDGTVVLTVNGKTYNVAVQNGQGSQSIAGLGVKTYPITAKYAGAENYSATSATGSLIVNPTKVSTLAEFNNAIKNASTKQIQLTKYIELTGTIKISSRGALIIDGNGKTLFGKNHRIFYIYNTAVTMKNLIMQGGKADIGGAIWSNSKLTITNCTFNKNIATSKNNIGGGAIYQSGGSLNISSSKFTSNVANKGNGGAIAALTDNVILNKCTFTSNKAKNGNGGAVANYKKGLKITSCTFKSNSATATKIAYGGALFLEGTTPSIKSSTFSSNTVKNHGGAVLIAKSVSGTIIDKCTFSYNKATVEDGGAISWSGAKGSITNTKFIGNYAKQDGGAIDFYNKVKRADPVITIKNCLFNKNKSYKSGAAVFLGVKDKFTITGCNFTNNVKPKYGGAVFFEGSSATITSCKFSGNQASNSGGAIMSNTGGRVSVNKCTFTSNKANIGGAIVNKAKGVTVQNSKFTSNVASRSGGAIALQKGSNTIKTSTFTSGKAIYGAGIFTIGGSATVTKNTFKKNVASKLGGAIFKKGGKLSASANKFSGNKGGKSPNIYKK